MTSQNTQNVNLQNYASYNDIISKLNSISLPSVWKNGTIQNETQKVLDISILIKSLICSILGFSSDSTLINTNTYDQDEISAINNFVVSTALAVEDFCDLLGYIQPTAIISQLTTDATNSTVVTIINDISSVVSFFGIVEQPIATLVTRVFATIASIVMYFSSPNFTRTIADYKDFKQNCYNAYESFEQIKNIKHTAIQDENIKSIIGFIITLCVIAIPIVNLVASKIYTVNSLINSGNLSIDQSSLIITQDTLNQAVTKMYGENIDFILNGVDDMVNLFVSEISKIESACASCTGCTSCAASNTAIKNFFIKYFSCKSCK
jgi:hypothetical protein